MKTEEFEEILKDQINKCTNMLTHKAGEYASGDVDRLHNFRVAAELEGVSMREALGGMMAKHTVSIYDLIRDSKAVDMDLWLEKITDHINYLLLLRAVVQEEIKHIEPLNYASRLAFPEESE